MKRFPIERIFLALLIAAIVWFGWMLSRGPETANSPAARLSDRSPTGGYALGYVLDNTGFNSQRQNARLANMPAAAQVWLILDPDTRFSRAEADALLAWVKAGHTLFLNAETVDRARYHIELYGKPHENPGVLRLSQLLGVAGKGGNFPARFSGSSGALPTFAPLKFDVVSNYRTGVKTAAASGQNAQISKPHLALTSPVSGSLDRIEWGKGRVFVFPDAWMLCNYGLAQGDNAVLISNLMRVHTLGGAVYFDERDHGDLKTDASGQTVEEEPQSLLEWLLRAPQVYGLWQLALALLGAVILAGRRLGSPVGFQNSGPTTRASQFAGAMGSLLFKVKRPQAAGKIIGENFRLRLARRVGLSAGESDAILARRAHEISGVPYETLERLLLQSRAPAPTEPAVLRDAQEMDEVLLMLSR